MDLIIRQHLTKAKEHNDPGGVLAAYRLIRDAAVGRIGDGATTKQTACFFPELHVLCAEEALQLGCGEISTACLKMYFEGQPPANQFLSRAYLCEGQLTMSQSTIGSVEDFEKAALCFLKAIEISKDKPRYHFLVFNASVLYLQAARPLLRPGLRTHLVPSLLQVVRALEEVAEQDHGWRAQLMILLVECLVDSGNTTDACSFAKVTQDFIKLHHLLHLYPKLFTLVVQHKLFETDCHEMTQQCTVIYKIQQLKDNTDESNVDKLKEEDAGAELNEIFDLLVECTAPQSAPVPPVDRVALLLELSLLSLQLKHPEMASDCLKKLRSASGDATAGQRIMMECVQCELCLLTNEGKMNDYSKACVEERLKEIRKLDQCLQSEEREGEPGSMQAVCASQWRACLPLLQPNLRRNVKAELLRVAQVLENTHSMLLDTRCQVHSELAVIEEEDGRLDAAWTHLHKALLLDDGTWRERLSAAVRLLQVSRGRSLCQATAPRPEDKAAMLLQQTKNRQPQDKTDSRPLLVEIGLLLAPDSFLMVLDSDNSSKILSGSPGSSPVAQLSAKAQHHSGSVRRVEGHLTRLGDDTNHKERLKLWAALAKTARKQEVWDVCRAACRFCLLYDNRRRNASKLETGKYLKQEIPEEGGHGQKPTHKEGGHGHKPTQSSERDLLCLLAEVCFINAEATIQKLRAEGQQFNSPAIPPWGRGAHVSAEDPHWAVYRDWIQGLSAHATSSFLRAAELGSEIKERWVVANAAIYLWNYNKHLLLAGDGEYLHLMPTLQRLVEMLRQTECYGDRILCVLLCDAVARGLIQPLCDPEDRRRAAPAEDKAKKGAGKVMERASSLHGGVPLDPAALQDIRKALELCVYALRLSNCNVPAERVPIAVRKRVVATWVQIKTHLQQQIGPKMDVDDECINESVAAMTRVLVGVEMLRYNSSNPRQMEFSVPSLTTLVRMTSDCLWSDAVVELQVWAQLAALCHRAEEHGLVLLCTQSALRLEAAAPCDLSAVNQMLSSVACLKALSLVQESNGDPRSYTEALTVLLSSVSYAEKAEDMALCTAAARHYWNACLPLTHTPAERRQLQQPLEKILSALTNIGNNNKNTKQGKVNPMTTLTTAPPGYPQPEASSESDLTVRVAIYRLLFYIHVDRSDWKSALQLLDKAIGDMPRTRHRLLLDKHRVLTRARLGESVSTDMQRFRDGGELYCSDMWRRVALCAQDPSQQLTCYQNAITSLVSVEGQWQKVGFLLEFGEWLYSQNFPIADTQNQVQWAVDILLHMDTAQAEGENEAQSNDEEVTPLKSEWPVGVQTGSVLFRLREVRRLDSLVRAYTLLAVMEDRTSPQYQLHLLRAYSFVLRIWKGSMAVVHEAFNETANNLPAQKPPSSASKKDKSKGKKDKDIQPPPPPTTTATDEKPKRQFQEEALPSSPQEWACYACPDVARQSFRSNRSPHCINTHSITDKTRCLFYLDLLAKELHSLSLGHLTLPVLHLAEVIAHDLVDRRSLSDLYRLRIVRICCQLGLETSSPYHGQLVNLSSIREQEQMRCRKSMALQRARRGLDTAVNEQEVDHLGGPSGRQNAEVCAHDIWLGKAEVCLSMGLYQHARQLVAEARLVATELGDQVAVARTLLSLAQLACAEQNHTQALVLLEKAQEPGGDEDFWYGLTLTAVQATVGSQRGQEEEGAHSKIDGIIKQGCTTLNSVVELRPNRAAAIGFLIVSLETRGAVEQLHVAGGLAEAGEALSTQAAQRLMSTCDILTQCASGFIKLGYREQAAEAHREHAHALRILAKHSANTERKRRHLLDAFYQMQLAVSEQEHVALNGQNLLPAPASSRPESPGLTLAARRKLQRLRLSLAELCLTMLELLCAEQTSHALARKRKSSVEMALEDFTRSTPDPDSIEQEWACVGKTLGQVTMGQLAATCFPSPDSVETRVRCLALKGKCQRLQATLKDPILPSARWDRHSQEKAWSEAKAAPSERVDAGRQKGTESISTEDKDAELQRRRRYEAQQLLAQASETLAQAVNLCLQHKLPSLSTLADASQDMLECHGQLSPVVAGQYLALLQSCRSAAVAAEVLSGACSADSGASRLSALISLRRRRRCQEEEGSPCSNMLEGVEEALSSLSKAYGHITINPNHLSMLGELPSNLRILLLQHTEDGSELYGAFYEKSKSTDAPKGRPVQATSSLKCSRVAKVSVCPRVLLMLRDRTATFSLETTRNLKDAQWHGGEEPGASQEERQTVGPGQRLLKTTADETLETGFRDIVRGMEDYLHPILSQLDFSCFRHRAPSVSDHHEPPKPREKDEKVGSDKGLSVSSPMESGDTLVVLADRRLLQLPLEALSILREEGLSSVTRDFSLQFLHNRLHRNETEKVESDNKKETKGGKATKGKGDQSRTIKVVPVNRVLPANAVPVDGRHFKYIVDLYEDTHDGTSLTQRMQMTPENLSQHFAGWEGIKQTPSPSEVEQLLCKCCAFVYLGRERFTAIIPPGKLAALNLSECRLALLFDLVQNSATSIQSNTDINKSAGLLALDRPLEMAVLLSLTGVRCIVLNQWHSSVQRSAHHMDSVLDRLLLAGMTSGQSVHALRKVDVDVADTDHKHTGLNDDASQSDSRSNGSSNEIHKVAISLSPFNCILYGLPNLVTI